MTRPTLSLAGTELTAAGSASPSRPTPGAALDWRGGLPDLTGDLLTLRELEPLDSRELLPLLNAVEVTRFLSPPPTSADRFRAFIERTVAEREAGRYVGFAIVPRGGSAVAGLVQLRQLEPNFQTAEWGIALGVGFWGRGLFHDAARLALDFAFEQVGVHRLEARVAVHNARANRALQKLGAVREGLLRQSLLVADGTRHDQLLWSVLADDWRRLRQASEELPWLH